MTTGCWTTTIMPCRCYAGSWNECANAETQNRPLKCVMVVVTIFLRGDCRKLVTFEKDGMIWEGIRAWNGVQSSACVCRLPNGN